MTFSQYKFKQPPAPAGSDGPERGGEEKGQRAAPIAPSHELAYNLPEKCGESRQR